MANLDPTAASNVHYATDPRIRHLAEAAWRMRTGGSRMDWLCLGKDNPEALISEAREWVRAAVAGGIIPAPSANPEWKAAAWVAANADEQPTPEAPHTETPDGPVCICGHPTRQHFEDACLLTGCDCGDCLELGALPEVLEAALTKRFTELGNPFSEMRRHEQGPDGWPSSRPVGPHQVAEVLRELLSTAPAVVAQPGKEPDTGARIVAHVLATHTDLHCLNCSPPPQGDVWTPVTADELDDGGVCVRCGVDVLIPKAPQ